MLAALWPDSLASASVYIWGTSKNPVVPAKASRHALTPSFINNGYCWQTWIPAYAGKTISRFLEAPYGEIIKQFDFTIDDDSANHVAQRSRAPALTLNAEMLHEQNYFTAAATLGAPSAASTIAGVNTSGSNFGSPFAG